MSSQQGPNFGASPQGRGTAGGVTTKGRIIIGLLLAVFVGVLYLGVSAISSALHKGGAKTATTSTSGGSSNPFSGLANKFFTTKADVTVCVVTWGGYAGGEYFNEGFKASKESRFYKKYGFTAEFKVIDDFGPSRDAWKGDQCQVLWITADSFPTEVIGIRDGGHDPRIIFMADNSRGGDVAVGTHEIKSIQDLRGKRVSYLANSPSNTLLLNMLDAANMTINDIIPVETPGAPQSAEAFKANNSDVGIVWSPDDDDALKKVPGAHVLMSTKQCTNCIADVFYAKESYIDNHVDQLAQLVEGWLTGAGEINSDSAAKDKAAQILADGLNIDKPAALLAINNARLATYGDNLNFFGLNPSFKGIKGEDLYTKMTKLYTVAGKISGHPPDWRSIVDLRVLKAVKLQTAGINAAEGVFTFSAPTSEVVSAPAIATKPLTVTFATGKYALDENAKVVIDLGFAHTAKGFASERIRVEGNTDDTGDRATNVKLSLNRAKSVANYLVDKYGFDPNRFIEVGNGPDKPVCADTTSECRDKNRRTDFELLK